MALHHLKTWPECFNAVQREDKTFEVRKNDRNFSIHDIHDILVLKEWDNKNVQYTERIYYVYVTYVLAGGQFGIEPDFVVLGIKPLKELNSLLRLNL